MAQAGSRSAFESLVARFQRPLFRFLVVRCGSTEEAEDLAQESFVRAWQRLALYDPRRRFSTWLFTLAGRLATSRMRSRGRRELANEPAPEPASELDGFALASAREERENLWAVAHRALGPERTAALWLRYVEDLSPRDVARALGRREATVRVMLFRSRAVLARRLAREGEGSERSASSAARALPGGSRCAAS